MARIADLSNPRIAALYSLVPAQRLEEFQAFLRDFPVFSITANGVQWNYLTGGQGDPPTLLLSGALTIPEISWGSIQASAAQRRVIVPAYPPVFTMDALVDGIALILRREGVEQVHVVGGSYGGMVAQVFVRRYPQMCRSLVLSHTQPANPENASRVRRSARMLRWLPMGMLRGVMRRVFQSMMPEWSEETAVLIAIYNEIIGYALSRKDVIAILERTVDYSLRSFSPEDLAAWPGKVLLVFGENDSATPPEVRQRMEALYPGCQVRLFAGSGHTTAVTRPAEYQAAINEFIIQNT